MTRSERGLLAGGPRGDAFSDIPAGTTRPDTATTNCGPLGADFGPRRRRWPAATLIVIASVTIILGLWVGPSYANEAPYRQIELARNDLSSAQASLEDATRALDAARADLVASSLERDFLSDADVERLGNLEEWRRRSRLLAVEAYIGGPDVSADTFMIVPEQASDLAYRRVLLHEHVRTTVRSSLIYANLVDSSDQLLIDLADAIDSRWRLIESLESDLDVAQDRVERAEWVLYVADIHALADVEFAQRNRREPTPTQWHELRMCESTNTYEINSGNGFYGAYQFDYTTWFTVGGEQDTRADMAAPEEQDARARLLFSRRGSQPWPVCGRFLDS